MNKKIVLRRINQDNKNNKILFNLDIDNIEYNLWYKVKYYDCSFKDGLSECFDSIVVTMLLYALKNGYDFKSEYPISEKLYYQIMYHIIPQIKRCNPDIHDILIDAPLSREKADGKFVATGISCGIDSLTTVYEYSDLCELDAYKITHLVYFKTGAHDGQIGKYSKIIENELFLSQLDRAKKFCNNYNYPLIVVDSNLNEILSTVFGFTSYEQTHTFRNCGTMLLFQNYFSNYYYSDTYSLDNFDLNIYGDVAHYEKWLLPLLSNENIHMFSSNKGMTRFEKTKLLSNYHASYDNLLVCWHSDKNCGKCDKCIRTLVSLDILNCLEFYKNSFNINDYRINRNKYINRVYLRKDNDLFFNEIYLKMDKKMRKKIYLISRIKRILKCLLKNVKI